MTYVREQSSTELAVHMRSLQKMPGWHDPLADRLWQEVEALKAEAAGLRTGYEAYERVNAELKADVARSTEREVLQLAEIEALRKALKPLLAHWDDLKRGESLNVDAARAAMGQGEQS
ncbi:hypothetical protein [Pseudomonas carnis]|uniref:hypothetical protein n=1 Tax=Pseudomonas carnis TaxID=2487355 RepID=UPI0019699AC7|nr:hypothetical protein [Pseudomonas carnis]